MLHKRLGKDNQKFEECIVAFLRGAEKRRWSTCLCAHHIFEYLAMYIHEAQLVGISPFLQLAPPPYLAPASHSYTLVFEPLGIMQHNLKWRPYTRQFIQWAAKHFDLVMWTWEMPAQDEVLLGPLEPYLFAKLYRFHCTVVMAVIRRRTKYSRRI
jgi:hypothetical protein